LEVGFLESVLAAPLPALQRFDVCMGRVRVAGVEVGHGNDARCLEALRPLARLSLPLLNRLTIGAGAATGQGVRWLEGAHLPALRHLEVIDHSASTSCAAALAAPRWSALEALGLYCRTSGGDAAALSAALAPTLRRLAVGEGWPFDEKGCAEEWQQLRSLEVSACSYWSVSLAELLGPVRLPRLERLAVDAGKCLRGFAARRAALPALRVVELADCFCGDFECPVVGCTRKKDCEAPGGAAGGVAGAGGAAV
jgi:hypothetical protein